LNFTATEAFFLRIQTIHSMYKLPHLLAVLALSFGPFAVADETPAEQASPKTRATLVAEVRAIAPGKPFLAALKLEIPDGWHSYYKNSGGVELPPAIQWKLPDGFSAGAIQWPVPEVVDGMFGKSYVYGHTTTFLVAITPPASLPPGSESLLEADAKWQICKDSCIGESATLTLKLPAAAVAESDPAQAQLFAAASASQAAGSSAWTIHAEKAAPGYRLRLTPGAGAAEPKDVYFVPDQKFIDPAKPQALSRDGKDWLLALPVATEDVLGNPVAPGTTLSGILKSSASWETAAAKPALAVAETTICAVAAQSKSCDLPLSALLKVFGGMFLGGLLLNLMPCVFPVIGLKILGFVQQAGQNHRKIVIHGILFSVGVLVSFWVLSGILFAARAAAGTGNEIGWGYQLQNPWVVLALMVLMFVMALSMFGLFELGVSVTGIGGKLSSKQGVAGTFFSGVLATVVATPCSAPFLGPAIGLAIGLPAVPFFAAFSAMALGLSTPYLVLSVFPALVNRLPRPGPWMETFKQGMSFLLFVTAGYLLWVYTGQIGLENMLYPLIGLTMIAIAAWIYGRWHAFVRTTLVRRTALAFTLIFGIGGIWACRPPVTHVSWEPWSEARVTELLAQGKPVYVDFTAQWCATCQFNKKRAYTKEVADLMKQRGITLLKGDKTNANPAIEAKLRELGRTAIPVNVLYVPGKEPIITPELLSSDYLLDLIRTNVPDGK
jgi:thiol:disulfide interchange protein DsbD